MISDHIATVLVLTSIAQLDNGDTPVKVLRDKLFYYIYEHDDLGI